MKFIEIGEKVYVQADHVTILGAPKKQPGAGDVVLLMLMGQKDPYHILCKDAEDAKKVHAHLRKQLGID